MAELASPLSTRFAATDLGCGRRIEKSTICSMGSGCVRQPTAGKAMTVPLLRRVANLCSFAKPRRRNVTGHHRRHQQIQPTEEKRHADRIKLPACQSASSTREGELTSVLSQCLQPAKLAGVPINVLAYPMLIRLALPPAAAVLVLMDCSETSHSSGQSSPPFIA